MYYIVHLLGSRVTTRGGGVMPVERSGHEGVRLLNVREAARYLGTTPRTLYTMAWKREIVFVKIGRSLRFDLTDLELMIENAKVRSSEPIVRPDGFGRTR
jgi:excisionase family DNA binding protein